jgi:hypothetical protein
MTRPPRLASTAPTLSQIRASADCSIQASADRRHLIVLRVWYCSMVVRSQQGMAEV